MAPRPIYEVKAQYFKTLGHPARIRILEVLRDGQHSVGELRPHVGIESSHLSQQLGVLRRAGIVESRREGSAVIYSVSDPRVFELLELARQIITTSLSGTTELLAELHAITFSPQGRRSQG